MSPLKASERRSAKDRCYWVDAEAEQTRRAGSAQPVDLLISHEWPSGIGEDVRGLPCGNEDLELLARELRPTLYVVGHMHVRRSATIGSTRAEALSHILGGPDASLIAEWTTDGGVVHDPLPVPIRDRRYAMAPA